MYYIIYDKEQNEYLEVGFNCTALEELHNEITVAYWYDMEDDERIKSDSDLVADFEYFLDEAGLEIRASIKPFSIKLLGL